jgi:spermidine/putrescine transport system substrate-binding protein
MRTALLFLILCFGSLGGSAAAPARLNLFIWSEYIDPAIVSSFEKQFECRVNIDMYEDAESMLAKVQGGGVSLYDVAVPPDHLMPALIKLNLLAPLRHENIPNLKNLEEAFANPSYDRGNRYSVAYQWGTVGIFARQPEGQPLPQSWGLLFDPKLQPRSFVLIDSMRDMLGAALKYKGYGLNSTDPKQLKEARNLVLQAKKRSLGFDGSVGGRNKVLGKVAQAAIVYSGEGLRGMKEDPHTIYFIPREGSQIWLDNLVVLAQAPHRDLAEKFVNFILEPKIAAQLAGFTQYSSPNKAARPFLRPEDLQNQTLYPSESVRKNLEFLQDLGPATRLYDEIWTQVKAR